MPLANLTNWDAYLKARTTNPSLSLSQFQTQQKAATLASLAPPTQTAVNYTTGQGPIGTPAPVYPNTDVRPQNYTQQGPSGVGGASPTNQAAPATQQVTPQGLTPLVTALGGPSWLGSLADLGVNLYGNNQANQSLSEQASDQSNANRIAQDTILQYMNRGIDYLKNNYDQTRGDFQAYMDAGQQSIANYLHNLQNPNSNPLPTPNLPPIYGQFQPGQNTALPNTPTYGDNTQLSQFTPGSETNQQTFNNQDANGNSLTQTVDPFRHDPFNFDLSKIGDSEYYKKFEQANLDAVLRNKAAAGFNGSGNILAELQNRQAQLFYPEVQNEYNRQANTYGINFNTALTEYNSDVQNASTQFQQGMAVQQFDNNVKQQLFANQLTTNQANNLISDQNYQRARQDFLDKVSLAEKEYGRDSREYQYEVARNTDAFNRELTRIQTELTLSDTAYNRDQNTLDRYANLATLGANTTGNLGAIGAQTGANIGNLYGDLARSLALLQVDRGNIAAERESGQTKNDLSTLSGIVGAVPGLAKAIPGLSNLVSGGVPSGIAGVPASGAGALAAGTTLPSGAVSVGSSLAPGATQTPALTSLTPAQGGISSIAAPTLANGSVALPSTVSDFIGGTGLSLASAAAGGAGISTGLNLANPALTGSTSGMPGFSMATPGISGSASAAPTGAASATPASTPSPTGTPATTTSQLPGGKLGASLINVGASFVGNRLASQVFDNVNSWQGTVGSAVGSIAGGALGGAKLGASLGKWGGPVGILVGSFLGAGLGSLFAGENNVDADIITTNKDPKAQITGNRTTFKDGTYVTGPFGNIGFYGPHTRNVDAKGFLQKFQGMAAIDTAIASMMTEDEYNKVNDLIGTDAGRISNTRSKNLMESFVGNRKDVLTQALGPERAGQFYLDDLLKSAKSGNSNKTTSNLQNILPPALSMSLH